MLELAYDFMSGLRRVLRAIVRDTLTSFSADIAAESQHSWPICVEHSVDWSYHAHVPCDYAVRPSVCLSVTFRCFVQTNKDTIVRFSASCRTTILVSGEVIKVYSNIRRWSPPARALKVK